MSKRPLEDYVVDADEIKKKAKAYEHINKHTLDSEEEDSDVDEDRLENFFCFLFKF